MQIKKYETIENEVTTALLNQFKGKIGAFTILNFMNSPHVEFSMKFDLYNYYTVLFNYDRGSFGCSLSYGDWGIGLDNSQKWYDQADLNIFCKELDEQVILRIPDKYLNYYEKKMSKN